MPIKFRKDEVTEFFKYIKTVDISFNPFDCRTRSAREMWRQLMAERYVKANPQLKINLNVLHSSAAPTVVFTLKTGQVMDFQSTTLKCHEMFFKLMLKISQIDAEYEMSGKSIDDE